MNEVVKKILEGLELCYGVFDYILEPEKAKILFDYLTQLQQENKQLKDSYCNRTDCSGRIKDSKKYDSILEKYDKQLSNWNELKNFLENNWKETNDIWYAKLILKMEELERGDY